MVKDFRNDFSLMFADKPLLTILFNQGSDAKITEFPDVIFGIETIQLNYDAPPFSLEIPGFQSLFIYEFFQRIFRLEYVHFTDR